MADNGLSTGRRVLLVISYVIFGALMAVSLTFCVAAFSSIDFSTGGSAMTNTALFELLEDKAVLGALIGLGVGVVFASLPGRRGRGLTLGSAFLLPPGTAIAAVMWAVAVSFALVFADAAGHPLLDRQREIILAGVWTIFGLVILGVLVSRPSTPSLSSSGYGGVYTGYGAVASSGGAAASAGSMGLGSGYGGATTFRTSSDIFGGGTTTRGDDGSTYHTTSDIFGGGTTTRGDDGTTYHTTSDIFGGGTTTRGDDGTTYHTTQDLFGGGYTTRGDDGSVFHSSKDIFGDGTTTRKE